MKFVVVNDIHCGIGKPSKGGVVKTLSHLSEKLLDGIVKEINQIPEIEFVANLGDLMTDRSRDEDLANVKKVVSKLGNLKSTVFHIVGNHEQRNLTDEDVLGIFGYRKLYFSHKVHDTTLIFLHTQETSPNDKLNSEIIIIDEQMAWFKKTLENANGSVIIFSHHSLADQDTSNNFYFSGMEHRCLVKNRSEIRKIIEDSNKVVACINAHLHWNNVTIHKDVPYITLQSLVEDFNTNGVPSSSYSIFELNDRSFKLHVMGNDRFEFEKYL